MKSNFVSFEGKEKFMELSLDAMEVLNENEFLLVKGGRSIIDISAMVNTGTGCECGPVNSGNGCKCFGSE